MNIRFVIPEQTIKETIVDIDSEKINYTNGIESKFKDHKSSQVKGFVLMFDDIKEVESIMSQIEHNPVQDIPYVGDKPESLQITRLDPRISRALKIADLYGQTEGDHHKAWVIDQMVRALCGCVKHNDDDDDSCYRSNKEYMDWVENYCYVDGEQEYEWDMGIAP